MYLITQHMKRLIVVRHAKSSWEIAGQDDFDRTLNARGKKDAPEMARRLLARNVKVDVFISSPAVRAKQTAAVFAEVYRAGLQQVKYVPALYLAAAEAFMPVIQSIDDAFDTAAVFSHNPGITGFVNTLTSVKIDDMPTCGVFAVHCLVSAWKDFGKTAKEFWFFDYPKSQQ